MFYLIGIEVISLAIYLFLYQKVSKLKIFICKVITSFIFVSIAFYALMQIQYTNKYELLIFLGIICGFLGDVFLGIRNLKQNNKNLLFGIGIFLFMIGHILYINGMAIYFDSSIILMISITIIFLLITIYITKKTNVEFGKLIIFDYCYILFSSLLLSITMLNAINMKSFYAFLVFIGVLSFVSSDFILSYLYFTKISTDRRYVLKLINIITYYVGQVILALSIMYL